MLTVSTVPSSFVSGRRFSLFYSDDFARATIESDNLYTTADPDPFVEIRFSRPLPPGIYHILLDLDVRTTSDYISKLYYDLGDGFSENLCIQFNPRHSYIVLQPDAPVFALRVDPVDRPATFYFSRFEIVDTSSLIFRVLQLVTRARARWNNINAFWLDAKRAIRALNEGGTRLLITRARNALAAPTNQYEHNFDLYSLWITLNSGRYRNDEYLAELSSSTEKCPLVSVICPVFNTPDQLLEDAVESVLNQTYGNFELVLMDDFSGPATQARLESIASRDERIKLYRNIKNLGIAGTTNAAVETSHGDILVFLDHDDLISCDAISLVVIAFQNSGADVVYSDDDKISMSGSRYEPQFKPDYSPILLLSYMYMSHIIAIHRTSFIRVGGCRTGFDGAQDHDLVLRLSEIGCRFSHIADVLYHWRAAPGSIALAASQKPEAAARGAEVVRQAFGRRGIDVPVVQPDWAAASNLAIYEPVFPDTGPHVTIIIPTRDNPYFLKRCLTSIANTSYQTFDVLIVNSGDRDDLDSSLPDVNYPISVIDYKEVDETFNFSRANNSAAKITFSEFVLFLNDDTEVICDRWLSQMAGYLRIPSVGAVGAQLRYPDGSVQHGGVVLRGDDNLPAHVLRNEPSRQPGYLWYLDVAREYSAVTAACMLVRRAEFLDLGGFDEENFALAYNDVEFCLRLAATGRSSVYCGSAHLYHHEGRSRPKVDNPREVAGIRVRTHK